MPGLADTRRGILDSLTAGMPGVLVTGDPREIVAPCVFVDLISLDTIGGVCGAWTGELIVYAVGTPDADAVGAGILEDLADRILTVVGQDLISLRGQLMELAGGVIVPVYAVTLATVVELVPLGV
jgi:hypothetical protein